MSKSYNYKIILYIFYLFSHIVKKYGSLDPDSGVSWIRIRIEDSLPNQAKVSNLGLQLCVQQDVFWLDVSMN